MRIILPFPPSINGYWRNVTLKTRKGPISRTLLSARGRQYRIDAVIAVKQQYPSHKKIDHRVKVKIHLLPPTLRKFDIDNFNKGILDALTHANFWVDDELVYDLHCIKGEKTKGGMAVVDIVRL